MLKRRTYISILVALISFVRFADSPGSAEPLVSIHVEVQHVNLTSGDTEKVRITITNTAGVALHVPYSPPFGLVRVDIVGSDGVAVVMGKTRRSFSMERMLNHILEPGASYTLKEFSEDGAATEWLPLSEFGFQPLPPGDYELSVTSELFCCPTPTAAENSEHLQKPRSNRVFLHVDS